MTLTDSPDERSGEDADGRAAEFHFELAYDGPEYQGEMSAGELASVLEGLTEYTQSLLSSRSLGNATKAQVKVRSFTKSSFDIQLVLEVMNSAQGVFVAAGMFGGAFAFWWKNMRRRVKSFEHLADRGTVMVTFQDDETIEISEAEWKLYNDRRARQAVRKILRPLRDGATKMTVIEAQGRYQVDAPDVGRFDELPAEGVEIQRFTVAAVPDTIRFDPTKTWRLDSKEMGGFTAIIEDKAFLQGIELNRVRVAKYDTFELGMRSEFDPTRDAKPHYYVERVINHIPGGEQDELPDGAGS
jgi:hypothetical protein